jgi:hypothetical protein
MCRDCTERKQRQDDILNSVEDQMDPPRVRHPKRRKKKDRGPRGCMGNEWGPHIYVWTTEYPSRWSWMGDDEFYNAHGFYHREYYTCVGCGKYTRSRETKEFARLKTRVGWYQAMYGHRRQSVV